MSKFGQDFKKFILKGNILDLAVAVIIGGAFGKIVASLVKDIIMPSVGLLFGGVNFTELKYIVVEASEGIEEAAIRYGAFIQSIIDFVIIGLTIFIFVRLITNAKKKKEEVKVAPPAPPVPPKQEVLLEEIRDLLKEKI
ncbi:MAG: large-conductance mechanosensitive channel protein MscL [Clostridiales bacterium]|nr:large-conductance mechanosensitive channel protein MscL [Clostridiales bacterium]